MRFEDANRKMPPMYEDAPVSQGKSVRETNQGDEAKMPSGVAASPQPRELFSSPHCQYQVGRRPLTDAAESRTMRRDRSPDACGMRFRDRFPR
jgi:hypothetical protein